MCVYRDLEQIPKTGAISPHHASQSGGGVILSWPILYVANEKFTEKYQYVPENSGLKT